MSILWWFLAIVECPHQPQVRIIDVGHPASDVQALGALSLVPAELYLGVSCLANLIHAFMDWLATLCGKVTTDGIIIAQIFHGNLLEGAHECRCISARWQLFKKWSRR